MKTVQYTIHCIVLSLLLCFTATAVAQSRNPVDSQVVNAVQTEQIKELQKRITQSEVDIALAMTRVDSLTASINRFTGIGIGLGATLTMLQTMLVILTYRSKNGK